MQFLYDVYIILFYDLHNGLRSKVKWLQLNVKDYMEDYP